MRCAFCGRRAISPGYSRALPSCLAAECLDAMVDVDRALDALAARMLARGTEPQPSDYAAAFDALEAAPLRTGPVDWTAPVEGWRLW